jgi:hypothetical protein
MLVLSAHPPEDASRSWAPRIRRFGPSAGRSAGSYAAAPTRLQGVHPAHHRQAGYRIAAVTGELLTAAAVGGELEVVSQLA